MKESLPYVPTPDRFALDAKRIWRSAPQLTTVVRVVYSHDGPPRLRIARRNPEPGTRTSEVSL